MASNDTQLIIEVGDFTRGIEKYQTRVEAAMLVVADTISRKMEEWAKQNARWTDRTGNARQLLHGSAFWSDENTITIMLAHGVDYGIWLELAMNRNYAILEESIEAKQDEFFRAIKKLVS